MQRCIRFVQSLLLAALIFALVPTRADAGDLDKPSKAWAAIMILNNPVQMYFILKNKNASFALGQVYWQITVRMVATQVLLYQYSGFSMVGKSESVEVDGGTFTPTETGLVEVKVTANSEVNISGEQTLVVQQEVIAGQECPRPTVSPSSVLVMQTGNTITYTAPQNCCFTITPFINTGVWYNMTPATPQTISNGQSVSFTLTPKDAKPMASVVGFAWAECDKGKPSGKDYIVVTPQYPSNSGDTFVPPGVSIGHLYEWYSLYGDPVSPSTGAFVHSDGEDIGFRAGPVAFARAYNSRALDAGMASAMGLNWSHTFDARLSAQMNNAVLDLPFGRREWFAKVGPNWVPIIVGPNAIALHEQAGNWIATDVTHNVQYTFNATGQLTKVDDGFVPVHIAWENGNMKSATDSMAHSLTFTSDAFGRITGVSDGSRAITYTYSVNGELTTAATAGADVITYGYDAAAQGRLTSISRTGLNNIITNTYNNRGYVVSQVDAKGNTWTYDYGVNTSSVTDAENVKHTHTFNGSGRATSIGTSTGAVRFVYDGAGRPTAVISAEGDTTYVAWHTSGQVASRRTPDGASTSYTYTSRTWNGATVYDLATITHPDGSKTEYTRDARGHATQVKGQTGATTAFTRNALTGYITSERDPMNRTTQYAFSAGHATSTTAPTGAVTTVATSSTGDVTSVTLPDGSTQGYMRDQAGRIVQFTNELGMKYAYTYDMRGNLTNLRYPSTATESWTYGSTGLLAGYTQGTRSYSFAYDAAGRLAAVHDPSNSAMSFGYDDAGNLSEVTDRVGATTRYGYDMDGRLTSSTTPMGHKTVIQRDVMGRVTKVTSPLGNSTTTAYNINGDITSTAKSGGRTANYTYDSRGLLTRLILPLDVVATYTYDASGSITKIVDPMGGEWVWGYDAGGRVASITDPTGGKTQYTYDVRDRVIRIDKPGAFHTMTYDNAGNLTMLAMKLGFDNALKYDADGRLTEAHAVTRGYNSAGDIVESNGFTMTRNANGRIATIAYGGGKTVTYAYDASDRVTSITDWTGAVIAFTRDLDGRVTEISRPNQITTTYTYDNDGRVSSITEGSIALTQLSRDAAGRVSRAQRQGHIEPTVTQNLFDYTYDAANNAIPPISVGAIGTQYDGFGRPFAFGQPLRFFIQYNDAIGAGIPGKIRFDQTWYNVIATPEGMIVCLIDSVTGEHLYPHYSESGNTLMVTNGSGAPSARFAYGAYGEILASEGIAFPFLFGGVVGTVHLGESKYAMGPRFYSAEQGRFTSADPIASTHPITMNAYQYANQDPINFEDWSGRSPNPQPSAADEIMRASNERLDAANRKTQEEYDARMRELEQRSAERAAEREARAKAERDARERLEREQQAERDRERADREAFDKAQKKAADLNDIFLGPPPTPPTQPRPVPPTPVVPPAPTGNGSAGGSGSAPAPRPTPRPTPTPKPTPTPAPAPAPTPGGNGGNGNGSSGTGRGSYMPDAVRDFLEYFIEFDSPR